ncbi:MAG: hypothetical protein Q9168_006734 [Polycauliona sp. 1 TL-2023]
MATSALYMASRHDLEDAFIAMQPCFKDKESEDNFKLRDQAISKLRRITAGNAPTDYSYAFANGIKALLEGIIKVINSLRTTVSKNACDFMQELAKAKMSNIDNIAEFVLPHLMKLCASTKKIGADKANETATILIANISYNIHLLRLIWSACDDKNVQPRKFATGWLKTLIGKHREHKYVFEKSDGLAMFEKCLKKGLADSNADVRQSMRPTYYAFIRLWPERSDAILSSLSDSHRKALATESTETAAAPAKAAAIAKSAAPKPKPSLKDAIAAKRQAAKEDKGPTVAEPSRPAAVPAKTSTSAPSISRPAPVVAATRTLSSAPVRPSRVVRKVTATSKPQPADLSKSVTEVSKSAVEVANTPSASFSKSAIELPKAATPEPPKSPILSMSPILATMGDRSQSPQAAFKRPLSPGSSSRLGLSSQRELVSPPLIVALRERSRSRSSSDASTTNVSQAPMATAEQSSSVAFQAAAATAEQVTRNVSEAMSTVPNLRRGNVLCSRKEGLARRALEELDINGPVRPCTEHGEEAVQKHWKKVETYQMSLSTPEAEDCSDSVFVYGPRQKLLELVATIKNGTWNLNTFRTIQSMIRASWPLLGDDSRLFDELLFALFNLIDSWTEQLFIVRPCGGDHNTQVLLTLRVMLEHHKENFETYYPRALCALLSASRKQIDSTHMRVALEETVMTIVNACDASNTEDSIDSVLDFLETYDEHQDRQPEYLGLFALTELMKSSDPARLRRPQGQASRLGRLAARSMRSVHPEVRLRAVDYAVTYASFLADDAEFWRLTSDVSNDRARLLVYYFTKVRTMQAFRVEEALMESTFGSLSL